MALGPTNAKGTTKHELKGEEKETMYIKKQVIIPKPPWLPISSTAFVLSREQDERAKPATQTNIAQTSYYSLKYLYKHFLAVFFFFS
jgi:hypothetical protein